MNRRAFLDRLDSAVQQQSQTVDRNRERVDAERARLLLASRDKRCWNNWPPATARRNRKSRTAVRPARNGRHRRASRAPGATGRA